ncbi:hypothetical protein P3T76_009201 [Phytophthora citrophthora]|uniref:Crinkler (CRN) family protein n=1 Tax=Phytophthora citrophthora TaxID=4793 RepID=A0AAD9GGH9_9STRA|nr:hypothetical protein P3T76_009201 [Phytophthora citrophthora]
MDQFPRMAHPVNRYRKILERDAYRVIYEQLMGRVKESFETRSPANLVVTGNPGTGKSWFYLYCIFQLILENKEEMEELPAFDLVLNFDYDYQLYDAKTKEFIKLNENEVDMLSGKDRVLRLVEAKSTHLVGWKGVFILFASPGLDGMNDYLKVDSRRYIMPVWTLEELQDYNSLLDDKLKLADDALISRYDKFGGIARSAFALSVSSEDVQLTTAIGSFDASKILSYAKLDQAVRDGMYSHRVIAMMPSTDDYVDKYYLDFLSEHIAEKVIFKMSDDSVQAMSHFARCCATDGSLSNCPCSPSRSC